MLSVARWLTICALVLALGGVAAAQGKKATPKKKAVPEQGEPKMTPEEQKAMQAMIKAGTPGKEHKKLAAMAGTWDAAVTGWMAPDKPAMKSKATVEKKMILGDRFLTEDFKGEMMGKPFNGMGLVGYDNTKKKYVYTWIDDMSTAVMLMEGTADKTGKVTFNAEGPDPMTGKTKKVRAVVKPVNAKKHVFEMYDVPDEGKPRKTMEIVYTKK